MQAFLGNLLDLIDMLTIKYYYISYEKLLRLPDHYRENVLHLLFVSAYSSIYIMRRAAVYHRSVLKSSNDEDITYLRLLGLDIDVRDGLDIPELTQAVLEGSTTARIFKKKSYEVWQGATYEQLLLYPDWRKN